MLTSYLGKVAIAIDERSDKMDLKFATDYKDETRYDIDGNKVTNGDRVINVNQAITSVNLTTPIGDLGYLGRERYNERKERKTINQLYLDGLVGKVPIDIINRDLPERHHQTLNHPLRPEIQRGEERELQGMVQIPVFGKPVRKTKDIRPIGLMWVYTAKPCSDGVNYGKIRLF